VTLLAMLMVILLVDLVDSVSIGVCISSACRYKVAVRSFR